MRRVLTLIVFALGLAPMSPRPLAAAQQGMESYELLVGSWEGELEYLDYGDNRTLVTLPTWLTIRPAAGGKRFDAEFSYEEPDGRRVGSRDRLYETPDGLYFGDHWKIEERRLDSKSGTLQLVLTRQGQDDGRDASIRNVIAVDNDSLTVTKYVEYSDTGDGLQRNQYRFKRLQPGLSVVGAYALETEGLRSATTGTLEVVGEPGDYFGRLTFDSDPPRVFALRLVAASTDSLNFTLPGDGYLVLRRNGGAWTGEFKYFGTAATLRAERAGDPAPDLAALNSLKPIGTGTISTEAEETFPTLDPDGTTFLFTRDGTIVVSELGQDGWSAPTAAPFSGEHNDSAPRFAPGGESILFSSNRPNPDHDLASDARPKKDLWIVKREVDGSWGTPTALPAPVNIDTLGEYHGSLAREGVVYFVSYDRPGGYGRSDIYRAEPTENGYQVSNLGPAINTPASEADVYVDPEERFILFAATDLPGGFGQDDVYISFRRAEGWSTPENLGPAVNSFAYEYGPWIDLGERMLYFTSYRRGSADLYRIPLDEIGVDLD